jgi:predicted transcriptional regulator
MMSWVTDGAPSPRRCLKSTPSFIQIGKRHQESLFFSVADVSAVPKQTVSQAASQKAVEHQADNSLQDQ